MYTHAAASDYDDWEKAGNPGWGSSDLIPLARKVVSYQAASGDPEVHGFTGPSRSLMEDMTQTLEENFWKLQLNMTKTDRQAQLWMLMISILLICMHLGTSISMAIQENVQTRNNRAVGIEHTAHSNFNVAKTKIPAQVVYASHLVVLLSGAFGSPVILEWCILGQLLVVIC
ncbi:hypothetical protein BT96DRAFT_1032385 [Gymnopus androsaceus JB14]|uniref:Uncharacterized protein n=1 Tax=Gymnopus androsaceus JB14 TaxID=1447944 RepID=A0A6A4HMX8_9AGAR|nr:hypothetical protein BT96DRAFT_1032385 [Gymnopus androsaceus JB14]